MARRLFGKRQLRDSLCTKMPPHPARPSSLSRRSVSTVHPWHCAPGEGGPGRFLSETKETALQTAPTNGRPGREQAAAGGTDGAATRLFHYRVLWKSSLPPPLRRPGVSPFMWAGVFPGLFFSWKDFEGRKGSGRGAAGRGGRWRPL